MQQGIQHSYLEDLKPVHPGNLKHSLLRSKWVQLKGDEWSHITHPKINIQPSSTLLSNHQIDSIAIRP